MVTQGNPEKKPKPKYLTLFLETWYDKESLQVLAKKHISDLMEKNLTYDKALLLSKGLAQSKFIGVEERDALIDYTLAIKPEGHLNSELPMKFSDVMIEIAELLEKGNYEKALDKLNEIENSENAGTLLIKLYCLTINFNKIY